MAEILFAPPEYRALGRNGWTHAHGLQLCAVADVVFFQPINSRGDVTRCRIPVPRDAIPDLIKELQAYV